MTKAKKKKRAPSKRYSQEKGNRFENRTIKRLWTAVERSWPWHRFETPDEGFHPPPELADWRFEFRARKAPGVYSSLKKARAEATYPDRIACVFSESGTDRAFETDRVFVAIPWSLFVAMLRKFVPRGDRKPDGALAETRAAYRSTAETQEYAHIEDADGKTIAKFPIKPLKPPAPGDDRL